MEIKIGQILENTAGEKFKIIKDLGLAEKSTIFIIQFIESGNKQCCPRINISAKRVRDYSKPFIYNVGYAITDDDISLMPILRKEDAFVTWESMMRRCYSGKYPLYENVTVCKHWHNFYNFKKWYIENYPLRTFRKNIALDKDLFAKEGVKKIYSPETCCFIPNSINAQINGLKNLNGVYSNLPEKSMYRLYELVTGFKEILKPKVYDKLYNDYINKFNLFENNSKHKLETALESAIIENVDLSKHKVNALMNYKGELLEFTDLLQIEKFIKDVKKDLFYRYVY